MNAPSKLPCPKAEPREPASIGTRFPVGHIGQLPLPNEGFFIISAATCSKVFPEDKLGFPQCGHLEALLETLPEHSLQLISIGFTDYGIMKSCPVNGHLF
jgi:hypothetical protein